MRKIGDYVYVARFEPHRQVSVQCPDCAGTGRIRVIMADETIVSVHCQGCSHGYENPTGYQTIYDNVAFAEYVYIKEIKQTSKGHEYLTNNHHTHTDKSIFDNEADALEYAKAKQVKYIEEQTAKIMTKEKDTKTWAWNASYHRRMIKDAEKKVEYHTAKLNAANLKVKA